MLVQKIKTSKWLVLLAFVTILSSCVNTQKLVEQGRYDEAVEYATKKLAGKKKKKAKYVRALESAFHKANERDMQRIAKLQKKPDNWERVVDVYQNIRHRQQLVEPLLPVIDKEGYHAAFKFVKVDQLENAAMKKAAEYLYGSAQKNLRDAENGNKYAARRAFDDLRDIEKYFADYRDKDYLMRKARALGTTHILFEMKNNAPVILPKEFEEEVLRMGVDELNGGWNRFHLSTPNDVEADFKVVMNINQIDVSPERIKEREYVDTREIEDGFDYVLDDNGNVLKDTLGNDIKVPRKVLIRARVLEVFQSKAAIVSGHLEYFDMENNDLVRSTPLSVESIFENYASTFRGDRRALSDFSRGRCNSRPLPFPTDEELLIDAAELMKPIVKEKIRNSRLI